MASLVAAVVLLTVVLPLVAPVAHAVRAGEALGEPHWSAAPASPSSKNVSINTTDVPAFVPNGIEATAGQNLTITLVNSGSYNHTFTMSSNGTESFPRNWSPAQLSAYFTANPPLVNVSMPANSTTVVNLTVNSSMAGGHFEFVSLVPYQFQAGLFGFLNVTPPVTSALTFYVNASDSYKFISDTLDGSSITKFPIQINVFFGTLGVLSHTFTLSPLPNYNLSVGNYTTFFTQHAPLVNIPAPTSAGTYESGSFILTAPGYYEFICTIQGHFASGMYGFLYAGIPVSVPYVPTVNTAIVQSEVLVGGGALLAIGLVLAAVAAVTGRVPPAKPGAGHH
ncbi:MAG TPA: sulfocyanin-like copper-binding protein [Thermoplasmata archaeon]|nr:sulfocyanin-like copper-binding protein [Thermoplasmata archaeon]